MWEKIKEKGKKVINNLSIVRAYNNLKYGLDLKNAIEGRKINTDLPKDHIDNYAHTYANVLNGQEGIRTGLCSLTIGVFKEVKDIYEKIKRGDNVAATLKDSLKDMKNNYRGVVMGWKNPETPADQLLSTLNWETNNFVEGFNNGLTQASIDLGVSLQKNENIRVLEETILPDYNTREILSASMKADHSLANTLLKKGIFQNSNKVLNEEMDRRMAQLGRHITNRHNQRKSIAKATNTITSSRITNERA